MALELKRQRLSPARQTAWELLLRVEREGAYLDRVTEGALRKARLSAPDRALVVELVHGVVRWRKWLDFLLQACADHPLQRYPLPVVVALRLGAYQLLFLERIPEHAAVHQTVELVKPLGQRTAGLVNAILRTVIRTQGSPPALPEDPVQRYAVLYSYPEWLVQRWIARFGAEEACQLLEAQNRRPALSLRVNPRQAKPEHIVEWLAQRGVSAALSPYAEQCLVVERLPHELLVELLENGWVSVQDVSAVLVVELAAVEPGMRVLDLCGAPGGKACAIAERLGAHGHITVVDIHPRRLQLAEREARRLGLSEQMSFRVADARSVRTEMADLVLVDAPCSGLGTLAKKPDIKWRRRPEDIPALARLQRQILHAAARLVRPGGVLLYSTCTTEPEENEELVADFLRSHPEFTLEPAEQWLPAAVCREGFLQTFPHRHVESDGAFAARLRRRR